MDSTIFQEFPNSMNRLKFDQVPVSCSSNRNLLNEYELSQNLNNHPNPNPSFYNIQSPGDLSSLSRSSSSSSSSSPSSSMSPEGIGPNNNAVLKYISDMLMEENLEGKTCMLQDCLALQAAEKSFYDVLGQEYPHQNSSSGCPQIVATLKSNNYHPAVDNSIWASDQPHNSDFYGVHNYLVNSPQSTLIGPDFHTEMNPLPVARKGIGDVVSRFFSDGDSLILAQNSSSSSNSPSSSEDKEERDHSPNSSRGRKNHQREESDDYLDDERSSKQSAISLAESELSEMFDEVLLCPGASKCPFYGNPQKEATTNNGQQQQVKGSNNGKTGRGKRQGKKGEVVDLSTLLTQCAQSVSINDQRTATELLKQIRQHSSPDGDGNQRLAHYFANALETRLAGTRTPTYSPILSSKTPVTDILKAYQVYVKACPIKKISNFFANQTIFKLAEKATKLHIIDFGILYGFQWPCLIQRLSQRPGGPPKLRITGIELPQPGFRPAERVEETGRRLQKYCERFGVPFEYHPVAQKWETIKYEDLNINRDEMTVVNCLYRMRNLPDDTIVATSARDTVLKLIKTIKPDIFIHGVVNGTYNAPFFVTRFREAIFHFSSLFDMFDVTVKREDEQRMLYEREIFGRDILNVIACEGTERVERPETYKQWQVRNIRAGFRQLPLDQEIVKKARNTVKLDYHCDFVVDENGQWMLQGWKGRVISAVSVWKPLHY